MESLVNVDWLAGHLDDHDLRVFDVTLQVNRVFFVPTVRVGLREYRHGHIPGSAFMDLFSIHDPGCAKRSITAPTPEHFAAAVGALGLGSQHRVVLFDRRDTMWAARVWWLLRAFGHDNAAILDGGWRAWKAAGLPVCTQPCHYLSANFTPTPRPGLLVGRTEVEAVIGNSDTALVNALGRRQHRGEVNEYGRRGHIPGSHNVTAWEILDRATGQYRAEKELRNKVESLLEYDKVIAYCGSGAAAASLAHALIRLGHSNVAVYDGGMMEWCAHRELPLELGP
jgi:thiosulfate/3-mercaptopyruvate sulfurtransferase